jgi:hypothetical protein
VETIERSRILEAPRRGRTIHVRLDDGGLRQLAVDLRKKPFSNQMAFLCDVPRLLGPPGESERLG